MSTGGSNGFAEPMERWRAVDARPSSRVYSGIASHDCRRRVAAERPGRHGDVDSSRCRDSSEGRPGSPADYCRPSLFWGGYLLIDAGAPAETDEAEPQDSPAEVAETKEAAVAAGEEAAETTEEERAEAGAEPEAEGP